MKSPLPDRAHRRSHGIAKGLSWNILAFAVIGAAGVAMNLAIARHYEPDALGVFNTVLAIFIVCGQLGALGVQYSVVYHTPISDSRGESTRPLLVSALLITAAISSGVVLLLFLSRGAIAAVVNSAPISRALLVGLPGIWLFPLNKVLLGYLNGLSQLRAYAIGNASRYVLIVGTVGVCIYGGFASTWLPASLTVAEAVLFVGLSITCRHLGGRSPAGAIDPHWLRRHLRFGVRALPAGVVSELNTRIDVLILGAIVGVTAVGVYSLASIFAEGLFQLIMVLRISFDPTIAILVSEKRWDDLRALVRKGKLLGYAAATAVGGVAVLLYPTVLRLILQKSDYDASWPVFATLAGGIALSAGFIPFSGLLQQSGHPSSQSLLFALVAATNLVGNIVMISAFGVMGAATATALSQVLFVVYLKLLVWRRVGFSL